jgi:hypothetical protein
MDRSAVTHGLKRVQEQIQEQLFELGFVDGYKR